MIRAWAKESKRRTKSANTRKIAIKSIAPAEAKVSAASSVSPPKENEFQQGALGVEPPPTGDDEAFFTEIARLILARTKEDPEFPRLLLHSELEGSSFSQLFRQMHSRGAVAHISSYIEGRIAAGGMIEMDPQLAAWSFLGMIWQFALSAYVFKDPMTPAGTEQELAAGFVRIFLKGVQRTPD